MHPGDHPPPLHDTTVEPLFADNARLWLRVWAGTQAVAIATASYIAIEASGGVTLVHDTRRATRVITTVALLAIYHVIGVRAYPLIMRRTWTLLAFVLAGWVLIASALQLNPGFSLLVLGAILQGFIFLPFAWAIATLALVTIFLTALLARGAPWNTPGLGLSRLGWMPATGVMIGTVLLYIHRANREAVLRTRLLRQLDDAQHDLAERARDAGVQEERQRLARDIHDTLAQGFTSVIKHLETIELSMPPSGAEGDTSLQKIRAHLAHAQAVSRTSLADIRHLVWALRPAELSDAPLSAALARVVAKWSDANGVAATFTANTAPALPPRRPDAEVTFLRATQEALSNLARHANARNVAVSLGSVDGLALLSIEDDGAGFAQGDTTSAEQMGLSGMRERVRPFGGHLLIDSTIGAGTSLTVAMPLSEIAAAAHEPGRGT